jgi:hypothetical protein
MWVDARSLFLFGQFLLCFFITAARFLLLMPLNVSLFSFMTEFNSNWFICVGFTNPSLFWSSHTCIKLHIKIESLDFTLLLKTLEIRKYLKHLRAKHGHHSNVRAF